MPADRLNGYRHIDVLTHDPESSAGSYQELFSWKIHRDGDRIYYESPCGITGAITRIARHEPPGFLPYVLVRHIDAVVDRLSAVGGVLVARHELPGWGRGAVFDLPGGPRQALWEPQGE